VDRRFRLAQDFHADGALAGNHLGIIVRVHEGQPAHRRHLARMLVGVAVGIAAQHDLRTAAAHRIDLDLRRGGRHHHQGAAVQPLGGQRHALSVIAGRRADHAAAQLLGGELHHLVVSAAQLERKHLLQVLALQQQPVVEAAGQPGRRFQRCFPRHVVHAGAQDALQIVGVLQISTCAPSSITRLVGSL
jgi:hypothetical protein